MSETQNLQPNALVPEQKPEANPNGPNVSAGGSQNPFEQVFKQSQAQFELVSKAKINVDRIQNELDKLLDKGDVVQPDDVIASAGKIVSSGMPAKQMATLLAQMPEQRGEILSGWLKSQSQILQEQIQQLAPIYAVSKHQMGVNALRLLVATIAQAKGHPEFGGQQQQQQQQMPVNPLSPTIQ